MRGVRAASSCSTVTLNPSADGGRQLDDHATGKPDGLGVGRPVGSRDSTSSPGSSSVVNVFVDGVLAAVGDQDLVGADLEARVAERLGRDGLPQLGQAGGRRVAVVLRVGHASTAASTMWSGVGKSGSPAPKPMTFSPAALSALALASTARVADSAMAATRAEIRDSGIVGFRSSVDRCR